MSFLHERGQSQILSHGFLGYRSPAASQSETDLRCKTRERASKVLWGNCSFSPLDSTVPRPKDRKIIKNPRSKIISVQRLVCDHEAHPKMSLTSHSLKMLMRIAYSISYPPC